MRELIILVFITRELIANIHKGSNNEHIDDNQQV